MLTGAMMRPLEGLNQMGMTLKDTVESNFLKIEDLSARMTRFNDGKPSLELAFNEHPKKLSVNVTCRKRLMLMFGEGFEVEQLVGQRIRLMPELTQDLQGNPMWAVWLTAIPGTQQDAGTEARQRIDNAIVSRADNQPAATPAEQPLAGQPQPAANTPQEPAGFSEDYDQSGGKW